MKTHCSVRDKLFVEPCDHLKSIIDVHQPGFSRARGVFKSDLFNMKKMEPARSYIGIRSKAHPNGFLFNFCPFCGTQIDEPFNGEKDEQGRDRAADPAAEEPDGS